MDQQWSVSHQLGESAVENIGYDSVSHMPRLLPPRSCMAIPWINIPTPLKDQPIIKTLRPHCSRLSWKLLLPSTQLEGRGTWTSSAQPTELVPLLCPGPRSRLCSDGPNAGTCSSKIRYYSRVKWESNLCVPGTCSKLLEAQQGPSCWPRRIVIPKHWGSNSEISGLVIRLSRIEKYNFSFIS